MNMAEPTLFKDGYQALVFAFNHAGQTIDRPMMNRLAAPTVGKGGMAGLDAIGQAGMIRSQVKKLGKVSEAVLIARTAPRDRPCECKAPCCSGSKLNREWVEAIGYLADYVRTTALAGCTTNGILRTEYVVRYFTHKKLRRTIESIAKDHDIDRNTVSAHAGKVNVLFAGRPARKVKNEYVPAEPGLESLALMQIEELLRDRAVVG
ncbi:hypothetical protein EJD96_00120 (plasmid) [Herbaspirillum seropedicae]|uniref:hypothetical protein n=1 Tax=Herbaspirillum seropedicae TaxID=964 RepID=UPI001121B899|nr:hypothetical protein [Herbaspirillum seropedicae]QDD62659.1 hypothetical protein EJD96_00120 [Herbaspirillum seropedicae]